MEGRLIGGGGRQIRATGWCTGCVVAGFSGTTVARGGESIAGGCENVPDGGIWAGRGLVSRLLFGKIATRIAVGATFLAQKSLKTVRP